jgi:hypothetical protein
MVIIDIVFQPTKPMKERIKDILAVILILLIIVMWWSIGTGVSQDVITIETVLAGGILILIALIHK